MTYYYYFLLDGSLVYIVVIGVISGALIVVSSIMIVVCFALRRRSRDGMDVAAKNDDTADMEMSANRMYGTSTRYSKNPVEFPTEGNDTESVYNVLQHPTDPTSDSAVYANPSPNADYDHLRGETTETNAYEELPAPP